MFRPDIYLKRETFGPSLSLVDLFRSVSRQECLKWKPLNSKGNNLWLIISPLSHRENCPKSTFLTPTLTNVPSRWREEKDGCVRVIIKKIPCSKPLHLRRSHTLAVVICHSSSWVFFVRKKIRDKECLVGLWWKRNEVEWSVLFFPMPWQNFARKNSHKKMGIFVCKNAFHLAFRAF